MNKKNRKIIGLLTVVSLSAFCVILDAQSDTSRKNPVKRYDRGYWGNNYRDRYISIKKGAHIQQEIL